MGPGNRMKRENAAATGQHIQLSESSAGVHCWSPRARATGVCSRHGGGALDVIGNGVVAVGNTHL